MIPAGWSELRSAFWEHIREVGNNRSSSYNLLKFYAVECGLKAVYLKRNNLRTTDQISVDNNLRGSHNLTDLVRELRLPATITGTNSNFRVKKDNSSWSIDYLHQAWRYGVKVEERDEKEIISWLDKLSRWIEENM